MPTPTVLLELIHAAAGKLFCDELIQAFDSCDDIDELYLFEMETHITMTNLMIESQIAPRAFVALRDAIYRLSKTTEEAESHMDVFFLDPRALGRVMRRSCIETLRIFSEILPNFSQVVLDYQTRGGGELVCELYGPYLGDFSTNGLEKFDFLVEKVGPGIITQKCISELLGLFKIRQVLPFLLKWIPKHPQLLDAPILKNYRRDLQRLMLQEESEICHRVSQEYEGDKTSLVRIVTMVIGEQAELKSRKVNS